MENIWAYLISRVNYDRGVDYLVVYAKIVKLEPCQ